MSDLEPVILSALTTITEFTSVRYIVREAQDEMRPEQLPFAVFTTSEQDFEVFRTMCGTHSDAFSQDFTVQIFAETAEQARSLSKRSVAALSGISAVNSVDTEFEPELRAFVSTIQFF